MTTTYRLPEKCGSIEVVPVGGCTEGCTDEVVVSPVGAPEIELTIAWRHLVKMAPPLPEEPTALGYYHLNPDKGDGFLVERQLDGWSSPVGLVAVGSSWEQLHEDYPCLTLTRLIAAPVVEPVGAGWQVFDGVAWQPVANCYPTEPVTLPWTSEVSLGRRVTVNVLGGGPIISIEDADGTYPNTCHVNAGEMARALWTADAVRERAS